MKNFTLYLNSIDATRFSTKDSRFGVDCYADEWKTAWKAYEEHINGAKSWVPLDIAEYALANWRQNLSSPLNIRKKPVTKIEFSALERAAVLVIENPVLNRDLIFRYEWIIAFDWTDSPNPNMPGDLSEGEKVGPQILYLEELRFPQEGLFEHEVIFLDGSRLLISAASLKINLSEYLTQR